MKKLALLTVITGIFTASIVIFLGFRQVGAADLIKTVNPSVDIKPGDTATIHLEMPGETQTIRNPADVMLVMDRSGSMGWRWDGLANCVPGDCKIESAKTALETFVDKTQCDVPPADHDKVGLATYDGSGSLGTLDKQLKCMNVAGKTDIKNAINGINPGGGTSIGYGTHLANQELLSPRARTAAGVAKYIVLATDGKQNTNPSPFSPYPAAGNPTILQRAKDNEITIFTVGIGDDIQNAFGYSCGVCKATTPDLNGNGIKDGEDLMMYIANETGGKYYFADDPAKLEQIYIEIANEISTDYTLVMIDEPNMNIVEEIVDKGGNPSKIEPFIDVDLWSCGAVPLDVTIPGNVSFFAFFGNILIIRVSQISAQQSLCIEFDVKIRDDAFLMMGPGPHPINSVKPVGACGVSLERHAVYFMMNGDCVGEEFDNPEVTIVPDDPWLKTTGGDVGSATTEIDMARGDPPIPDFNADYLVIAGGAINYFSSARSWLVPDYDGGVNIYPEPISGSMYDAMHERYAKRCSNNLPGSNPAQIANAITPHCNVLTHTGAFTVGGSWTYDGPPAIIFIDHMMVINSNLNIVDQPSGDPTGLIFVVEGQPLQDIGIDIGYAVEKIDGIFVTDKEFNTGGANCGSLGSGNPQLIINGAVYVFGEPCFTRGLTNNLNNAAEIINYEPKYLWIFRETLGDEKVRFEEVAP